MKYFLFLIIACLSSSGVLRAQSSKAKTDTTNQQTYTCSMHPEVITHHPGNCPKCGMTLVPVKKTASILYTCPMHPEITSAQPGKCPKCGMNLVEKKGGQHVDSSLHKRPM